MYIVHTDCSFFDTYNMIEGPFDTYETAREYARRVLAPLVSFWGPEHLMITQTNETGGDGSLGFAYCIVLPHDKKDEHTLRMHPAPWDLQGEPPMKGDGDTATATVIVLKVNEPALEDDDEMITPEGRDFVAKL